MVAPLGWPARLLCRTVCALDVTWSFEAAIQDRCAERIERFDYGSALFRSDLSRVYDENFLRVERGFDQVTARQLVSDADRLQGASALGHRKVVIPDEAAGRRLEGELGQRRFRRSVLVTMAYRGGAPPEPAHEVAEVGMAELRASRLDAFISDLHSQAARQIVAHLELVASVVPTRAFAVMVDGQAASWCVLYEEGGVGQIDDVVTIGRHRRKGYGRAVVLAAVGASLEAGNELTFLVADDDDWPKQLYADIGFEPIGRRYEFTRA
jgi:ribosomal protein S18 acetylase RimI-like enzyme